MTSFPFYRAMYSPESTNILRLLLMTLTDIQLIFRHMHCTVPGYFVVQKIAKFNQIISIYQLCDF